MQVSIVVGESTLLLSKLQYSVVNLEEIMPMYPNAC